MCAHAVRVALTSVNGVDKVDVSLNQGLATVDLKPGNNVTMKQLQAAITKNGFVTKQSTVVVWGTLRSDSGKLGLEVANTGEMYELVPETSPAGNDSRHALVGKLVMVTGTIPEIPANKVATVIHYRTITTASGDLKGETKH